MCPTMFGVNWLLGLGEEAKNRFSGSHLGFPIGMILAIFDLQVTPMLPTKFGELAFRFRRRSEKYIFKMAAMVAILDFDRHDFSYFLSTSHPDAS